MIVTSLQCVAGRMQTQSHRAAFETLNINGIVAPELKLQLFAARRSVKAGTLTHISDAELDFFDSGASHLSQTVTQPECAKIHMRTGAPPTDPYGRSGCHETIPFVEKWGEKEDFQTATCLTPFYQLSNFLLLLPATQPCQFSVVFK